MSADTLRAVEDAIFDHIRDEYPGDTPAGWVLSYQVVRIQTEGVDADPLEDGNDYAVGAGTSLALAIGLARSAQVRLEHLLDEG